MRPSPAACRQCVQLLRTQASIPTSRTLPRSPLALLPSRPLTTKSTSIPRPTPARNVYPANSQRRSVTSTSIEPEQAAHPEAPGEHSLPHPLTQDPRILLKPGNLFHPMDASPSPSMRERAAYIKANAYCPHPDHAHTHPSHIAFTCPDCGIPTYCSEEHFLSDYENHLLICDTLREVNEDDHDLRSGRFFPEFDYPGVQLNEALINFTNWDTYLYTRGFEAVNEERSLRQLTKLLTYPTTIASVLHELSPYSLRNGLTNEGLKSLAALRYTLHPPLTGAGQTIKGLRLQSPPVRLFILGARAESSLPRDVWHQLAHMFPQSLFHLVFIGPESMANRESELPLPPRESHNPFGAVVERVSHHMKISTFVEYYNVLHDANYFAPFDPYFDAFVCFHPGFGHPGSAPEWVETLPRLLETKVPVICTGYTEMDLFRDVNWVKEKCAGEFDLVLEPQENRFKSLRWDMNDNDPTDLSQGNWGLWAFRGKRYEAVQKEGIFTA